MASLILAYLALGLIFTKTWGAKTTNREALTGNLIVLAVVLVDMMDSTTNKRKETNINARVV